MSAKTEIASHDHGRGYACSEAVLASFSQDYGLSEDLALRMATGFRSGMGRMSEVCGALSGAMVIGLKHGRVLNDGTKYGSNTEPTNQLVAEISRKFQERNGLIHCRDLIGHDLSIPEEQQKLVQKGLFSTTCGKFIRDAVELLEEVL